MILLYRAYKSPLISIRFYTLILINAREYQSQRFTLDPLANIPTSHAKPPTWDPHLQQCADADARCEMYPTADTVNEKRDGRRWPDRERLITGDASSYIAGLMNTWTYGPREATLNDATLGNVHLRRFQGDLAPNIDTAEIHGSLGVRSGSSSLTGIFPFPPSHTDGLLSSLISGILLIQFEVTFILAPRPNSVTVAVAWLARAQEKKK